MLGCWVVAGVLACRAAEVLVGLLGCWVIAWVLVGVLGCLWMCSEGCGGACQGTGC